MKKNKMMRVASVLLVAVLLTTSIISGTFAKYVTSDSTADSARVAKFGVLVTASGNLFAKSYFAVGEDDGNQPGDKDADTTPFTELTVETSNADNKNLVAPGTKSTDDGLEINITGKPEVDVKVTFDFNVTSDVFLGTNNALPDMTNPNGNTFDNATEYHPIVFTLKGDYLKNATLSNTTNLDTSKKDQGIVSGSLAAIQAVFSDLNGANGIYVDANTDLGNVATGGIGTLTLTWEWPFEDAAAANLGTLQGAYDEAVTGGDASTELAALNAAKAAILLRDQKDTLLGDIAAGLVVDYVGEQAPTGKTQLPNGYTNYSTEIGLSVSVTVTQVD